MQRDAPGPGIPPSHGGNRGSNPLRDATSEQDRTPFHQRAARRRWRLLARTPRWAMHPDGVVRDDRPVDKQSRIRPVDSEIASNFDRTPNWIV